jgi:predicted Fe-Mo cluster-binding NifX family protein
MPLCLACYGDRVASLLDGATELRLYGPSGEPAGSLALPLPVARLGLPGLLRALRAAGAAQLICGGLTGCALEALARAGLEVGAWVAGEADAVVRAWADGRLDTMRMPGCGACLRKRRRRAAVAQMRERLTMNTDIIAITSEGPALTDMVDPRFGRAGGFVVVDLANGQSSYVDNGGSQTLSHGAGIQAAENVARAGARVVLSGFVGPKAFAALVAAGIQVVQNVENMTVGQAVDRYRKGEFAASDAPNAQAGGRS